MRIIVSESTARHSKTTLIFIWLYKKNHFGASNSISLTIMDAKGRNRCQMKESTPIKDFNLDLLEIWI